MIQGNLDIDISFFDNFTIDNFDVYNIQKKSGSRIEYSLILNNELYKLAKQISNVPLRYASIVKAEATLDGKNQEFHFDSVNGERAIIYLTDVDNELNGPIEFKKHGKILGKKGTFVHYSANEIHRGCSSNIERYALALAFNDVDNKITTIGGTDCNVFECPSGYITKDPVPEYGPETNNDTEKRDYCCTLSTFSNDSNNSIFVFSIALLVIMIYFYSINKIFKK